MLKFLVYTVCKLDQRLKMAIHYLFYDLILLVHGLHLLVQCTELFGGGAVMSLTRASLQVTKQHNEDCRKLLRLMGVPVVEVCTLLTSRILL